MPKPSQSGRKRFFYNQNIKRDKSNHKYKNLLNHIVFIIKKLEKEGMTKWVANALNKVQLKIKSYGINFEQVLAVFEHKGLSQGLQDLAQHNLAFVQKKGHNKPLSTKRDVLPTSPQSIILSGTATSPSSSSKKPTTKKSITIDKRSVADKKPATKKISPVKKSTTTKKTTPIKKSTTAKKADK